MLPRVTVGQGIVGVKTTDVQPSKGGSVPIPAAAAKPQALHDAPSAMDMSYNTELVVPKQSSGKVTNNALPPGTRTRFVEVLIPRLLERLGRRDNPWAFQSNAKAAAEVAELWEDVFPSVPLNYTFNTEAPVFKLVRLHCLLPTYIMALLTDLNGCMCRLCGTSINGVLT